jgi:hypothetical protein
MEYIRGRRNRRNDPLRCLETYVSLTWEHDLRYRGFIVKLSIIFSRLKKGVPSLRSPTLIIIFDISIVFIFLAKYRFT